MISLRGPYGAALKATVAEGLPAVSLYTPRSNKGERGGGLKEPIVDGVTSAGTVSLIGYVCFCFVYLFATVYYCLLISFLCIILLFIYKCSYLLLFFVTFCGERMAAHFTGGLRFRV
jgi:hypothetical protein